MRQNSLSDDFLSIFFQSFSDPATVFLHFGRNLTFFDISTGAITQHSSYDEARKQDTMDCSNCKIKNDFLMDGLGPCNVWFIVCI